MGAWHPSSSLHGPQYRLTAREPLQVSKLLRISYPLAQPNYILTASKYYNLRGQSHLAHHCTGPYKAHVKTFIPGEIPEFKFR